ncbi:hypothetical protein [Sphaerisporangium corydalis]|uniref:Serine/threonine protein kinase n=1 Tax=Sphaerisporangium corydalis TaxID=1441875 RepID=A0ABV9EG86_9ACTN|nr:hypothetical protein [Sphaerisporangium corydalis]
MSTRVLVVALSGVVAVLLVVIVILVAGRGDGGERASAPRTATPATVTATPASPAPVTPAPVRSWDKGRCLDVVAVEDTPGPAGVVPCESPGARSKIIALAANAPAGCPPPTDASREVPAAAGGTEGRGACLRNLAGPHAGDPGKGGGILRVGDCVYIAEPSDTKDTHPQERPCTDKWGPGKIYGFYKKKSQCKYPSGYYDDHYTNRRDHSSKPVICTTEGYDVVDPGAHYAKGICVRKPRTFASGLPGARTVVGDLDKISCGAKKAWSKVVATVSHSECPRGTTSTLVDTHWYPSTTCLRKL